MANNLYEFYKEKSELYSGNALFNGLTYAEGFKLAEQRASFLQAEGYRKGDVIAILAKSNAEWILSYMAINMIGGIVLPLDVNLAPSAYPEMIKKVKAKALFVSEEYKGVIKELKHTRFQSINRAIKKGS